MTADRYNPAALINKGNTLFVKQDYDKAAEFFKEALRNDSSCTEALYNLGTPSSALNPNLNPNLNLNPVLPRSDQCPALLLSE